MIAIENENLEMIQFLLESGINPKVGKIFDLFLLSIFLMFFFIQFIP